MSSQLFSNNASTTLSAGAGSGDTSLTVTDGSAFNSPTGGDWELLTVEEGATLEIVKLTARATNTLTVTRGQEGTTPAVFTTAATVSGRVTKSTLDNFLQESADKVIAGKSATGAGAATVALGQFATADGANGVALGNGAVAATSESVALGPNTWAQGSYDIALGSGCQPNGGFCIAIGADLAPSGANAVTIGYEAGADGASGLAIGHGALASADYSVGVGFRSYSGVGYCNVVGGMPIIPKETNTHDNYPLFHYSAAEFIVIPHADLLALTATADPLFNVALPAGCRFFPTEVGLIITGADTVTGQPTISFGGATTSDLLAATATTGLTAVGHRARFATLLGDHGVTSLQAAITVAATATAMTGRFYFRGFLVEDE